MSNKFSVYSPPDIGLVMKHRGVGNMVLSDAGTGRISISRTGDLASMTTSATGYVVVNKLVSKNGAISLEIPKNSDADEFLRKWIDYLKKAPTKEFALTTMTLTDPAAGKTLNFTGVVPQRKPDDTYEATSGNLQYNLLYAEETEGKLS